MLQLRLRQFPGDVSPGQAPAAAPWRRSWWVQLDCFSFLRLEDTFLSQRKQPFQGFLRAGGGGGGGSGLRGEERRGRVGEGWRGGCLQEKSEGSESKTGPAPGWLLSHPTGAGGDVVLGNPWPASLTPSSPCPGCCLGDRLGWDGVGG